LVAVEPVASLAQALTDIQHGSLSCDGECPANVGMLLAADTAGGLDPSSPAVLGCTAVLVSGDLALTNSHCIPSAVKLLPDLCRERVRLVLPAADGAPEETVACAALLGHSERATPMSPDLALLRLERDTGRAAPLVDRAGVEPGARLESLRVNPDLKARTGRIVRAQCTAAAGSFRMPVYATSSDPVFVTGDCAAIAGNSGSPILDDAGHLRGLLQAELPLSDTAIALWKPHLLDKDFAPLAMGTSLGCLTADPAAGAWAWRESCRTIEESDVAAARPRLRALLAGEELSREVESLLVPFRAQSPLVEWERDSLSVSAFEAHERLLPACARALETPVALSVPRYKVSLRFNRYLQLAPIAATLEGTDAYQAEAAEGRVLLRAAGGEAVSLPFCSTP
jgi:hypothetical protein